MNRFIKLTPGLLRFRVVDLQHLGEGPLQLVTVTRDVARFENGFHLVQGAVQKSLKNAFFMRPWV